MRLLHLPEGTRLFLGRPARPPPPEAVERLRAAMAGSGVVEEAHLPHAYIPAAMSDPGPLLVLLTTAEAAELERLATAWEATVADSVLPPLTVLPLARASHLWSLVREVGRRLL